MLSTNVLNKCKGIIIIIIIIIIILTLIIIIISDEIESKVLFNEYPIIGNISTDNNGKIKNDSNSNDDGVNDSNSNNDGIVFFASYWNMMTPLEVIDDKTSVYFIIEKDNHSNTIDDKRLE